MGLISKEVEITINGNAKRYEDLGYCIPKIFKNNRWCIDKNKKIKVKVSDLSAGSNAIVKVKCDYCGNERDLQYTHFLKNIKHNNGLYMCIADSKHRDFLNGISPDVIKNEIKNFYNKNKRFPMHNEYTKGNEFSFSYSKMHSVLKSHNIDYKDLLCEIDFLKAPSNIHYYNKYIEFLKNHLDKNPELGLYSMSRNKKKIFTPDIRWLIENCPDKNVKDVETFREYLGIKSHELTKEECVDQILKTAKEFNRPLMYDDFRNYEYRKVTITDIRKHWGSLNKMKKSLGLEIVQESMLDRSLNKEELDNVLDEICEYVRKDSRNFITTREINSNKKWNNYWSLNKYAINYYKMSFCDLLNKRGINLGEQGRGLNFYFEDGEHTTSQYEYMFSNFLKENGFIYNKDYFRDIKYKTFIRNYTKNMNCDYVLHFNGEKIYIEIAGIIEAYKTWYYENKEISTSKSKEVYRQKLLEKEEMLKSNNLKYFILFPCDLTTENFKKIISNPSLELKHNIECFHQNNIDWHKVREIGELDYSKNVYRFKNNELKAS